MLILLKDVLYPKGSHPAPLLELWLAHLMQREAVYAVMVVIKNMFFQEKRDGDGFSSMNLLFRESAYQATHNLLHTSFSSNIEVHCKSYNLLKY